MNGFGPWKHCCCRLIQLFSSIPDNTKFLYNIYTMLDQRRRRLAGVVYCYLCLLGRQLYTSSGLWWHRCYRLIPYLLSVHGDNSALQRRTAATAYFKSKQLLLFAFALSTVASLHYLEKAFRANFPWIGRSTPLICLISRIRELNP